METSRTMAWRIEMQPDYGGIRGEWEPYLDPEKGRAPDLWGLRRARVTEIVRDLAKRAKARGETVRYRSVEVED